FWKIFISCLLLTLGAVSLRLQAHEPWICTGCNVFNENTEKLAKCLVSEFWLNVVIQDVEAYSNLIAKEFQGLNVSGHFNKEDAVKGLMNLTVDSFILKNLVAARYHHTLVISYDFLAKGHGIVSGPTFDVWHKIGSHWKLISHGYVPFPNDE